jgi:hypothetical protein
MSTLPRIFQCFLLASPLLFASAQSQAAPITSGQWYTFAFTAIGVDATGCQPADPAGLICTIDPISEAAPPAPWTFSVGAAGATLLVTDAFTYGDAFDVFNFGALIGSTSLVDLGTGGCGSDPEACAADPLASTGLFNLAPGNFSLTIQPYQIVSFGAGNFILRGDVLRVPEPGSLLLASLGLGLLFARRRYNG